LARDWYSSMVRAKAVRAAEREPSAAGEGSCWEEGESEEGEVREAMSLRIAVRCFNAELKVVFWREGEISVNRDRGDGTSAYHLGCDCLGWRWY